ncbi:hypothetical protein ENVG_00230 [Emiliania huxleyi virus 84]|nr:hypothetical protein ENVG_00230 [Emiliania huxleyi virus 84]AEP15241.1 hypothetical protein EOVG_00304 [Emiliania huxleyi virus 88]
MSILGKRNEPDSFFDSHEFSSFIDRAPIDILLKIYFINQFDLNERVSKKKKQDAECVIRSACIAYADHVMDSAADVLAKTYTSFGVYHAFDEVARNTIDEVYRITNDTLSLANDYCVVHGPAAEYNDLCKSQADTIKYLKDAFDFSVDFALS